MTARRTIGAIACTFAGAILAFSPLAAAQTVGFTQAAAVNGSGVVTGSKVQAQNPNSMTVMGDAPGGGVGVIIDNVTAFSGSGKALSIRTGGVEGSYIDWNGSLFCNGVLAASMYADGIYPRTGTSTQVYGNVTSGAGLPAFVINNQSTLSGATDKLVSIRNNGVEKASFANDGSLNIATPGNITVNGTGNIINSGSGYVGTGTVREYNGAGPLTLQGGTTDSASAVGVKLMSTNTLSTAGSKIVSVSNNGAEKQSTDFAGKITYDTTDGSGTPGAATINKPSFKVAIAAAASSVVVTNSEITAASTVLCNLQTTDATATFLRAVIPAAGSVTINVNANATAATKVGCLVVN